MYFEQELTVSLEQCGAAGFSHWTNRYALTHGVMLPLNAPAQGAGQFAVCY